MPLREAIGTWPAQDLVDAIRNLPLESATVRSELGDRFDWNHLAANIAELVDLMHFKVQADYTQWITDPDDPKVKAELADRKRRGIKPPPVPIVPPVAHRPDSVATDYVAAYQRLVEQYLPDTGEAGTRSQIAVPGKRWVTTAELDKVLELL